MRFIPFPKLIILFSLVIFSNCHSSQQQSFHHLQTALIDWYYKYHPTIAIEQNILDYANQIEKNDFNSIEEYKADINRFMIELSQIDETKLKNDDLIEYLIVNQFLFQKYNDILNFQDFSYNPKLFLENLYNSLFFIIHNNNLNMEQKSYFILSKLEQIPVAINNIQKNIIYYSEYDIKEAFNLIFIFEKLLNALPLYINSDDNTLDQIDDYILNVKNKIINLKAHLKNMDDSNIIDMKEKIINYLSYNENIKFDLEYDFLINKIYNDMLDISLPIYKINNDEPVWVDREDTLNIISMVLNESLKEYPDENEIIMNLDESLNRINLFSKEILNLNHTTNNNYEIIINEHTYLESDMLYRLWNDKTKTYLFLNKSYYQENNKENKFNQFELDLDNISNYFPGKYLQKIKTQEKLNSISSIFVDDYTNSGWGLLSQYFLIDQGYGDDNNIYMLIHLKNTLNSILKNMIFVNYYINGKSDLEIEDHIYDLTFYTRKQIKKMILNVIKDPLESNFEIIGYFKLKKLYHKFGKKNPLKFHSILIENAHLNPNFIKEFKFPND